MKKISTKLSIALAALVVTAFAVPAMASASAWTMEGEQLTESHTLDLDGTVTFASEGGAGGISCVVDAEAVISPGSEGEVVSYAAKSCNSFGAFNSVYGCQVAQVNPVVPWDLDITSNGKVGVSNVLINVKTNSGCFFGEQITYQGGFRMAPDNTEAISYFGLSSAYGEMKSSIGLVTVSGQLNVTPAETYGIE